MTDRVIVYQGAIPQDLDILNTNKNMMISLGMLAQAILGNGTLVDGLACTPTGPASLNVLLAPGSIMSLENVDGTAYGSIGSDTTHQIVKQGIRLGSGNIPATGSFAVPSTTGQSVNYLIQIEYQDVDGGSTVLPYYNAANPAVAFNGPANLGTSQNTVRSGSLIVNVKAGTAATSGSQVTPTPDAGFTGLWVITVANGVTTIVSGNIAPYTTGDSNPIISEKLKDKISLATGDARYAFSAGGGVRTALTNDTTFYVSPTGNDSNAGTIGSPWLTISHALGVVARDVDQRGFTATIQVGDTGSTTTYTTGVSGTPSPTGPIQITGNAAFPTRVVISTTSNNGFSITGDSIYQINLSNMQIQTATTGYGVATTFGRVGLSNITFGPCAQGYHTASGPGGYIEYNGPITWAGNASLASQTYQQGQFNGLAQTVTLSGTPIWGTACVLNTGASCQFWGGVVFTGTGATGVRYQSNDAAIIQTGGGGANFFPGNAAGTISQGFYS